MLDTQKTLTRVRPPRVKITCRLFTGGAEKVVELPEVIGIISDLSGIAEKPGYRLRKFVEVDKDNLVEFMARISPSLSFSVKNLVEKDVENLAVNIVFKSIEDFDPSVFCEQIPILKEYKDDMRSLSDLQVKINSNDMLYNAFTNIIKSKENIDSILSEIESEMSK